MRRRRSSGGGPASRESGRGPSPLASEAKEIGVVRRLLYALPFLAAACGGPRPRPGPTLPEEKAVAAKIRAEAGRSPDRVLFHHWGPHDLDGRLAAALAAWRARAADPGRRADLR